MYYITYINALNMFNKLKNIMPLSSFICLSMIDSLNISSVPTLIWPFLNCIESFTKRI